jgi:hypothetical protein
MLWQRPAGKRNSPRSAKLFRNGRSQAVRLPADFRLKGSEVFHPAGPGHWRCHSFVAAGAALWRRTPALSTGDPRVVPASKILPWDAEAAQQYGHLRAALERGEPMGNLDLMIGAHALASDLILVTHDPAFNRIKHLKREDWTKV